MRVRACVCMCVGALVPAHVYVCGGAEVEAIQEAGKAKGEAVERPWGARAAPKTNKPPILTAPSGPSTGASTHSE